MLLYQYGIFQTKPFNIRTIGSFIIRFTQTANFFPNKAFTFNSTYWFYSMIIQLHFCFPILQYVHKKHKFGLWIIVIISYIFIILCNSYFSDIGVSLYFNFAGNLPVFIFGMFYARGNFQKKLKEYTILAISFFILGQYFEPIWHFTQISFVLLVLFFLNSFKRISKQPSCPNLYIFQERYPCIYLL